MRTRFVFLALLSGLLTPAAVGVASADPPPAPSDFTVTPVGCTTMQLTWSDVDNEDLYAVFRDGELLTLLAANTVQYVDMNPGLNPHNYCILADNADGGSPEVCAVGSFVTTSPLMVDGKHWFQDTFTSNETITSSAFSAYDTTSAWVRTGLNLAQFTGTTARQDLPGDTLVCNAPGSGLRVDLVFRILPGVGNYVTIGNRASGLRRVPTSPTAAVPNAASTNFWESYLADNGAVGTGGNGAAGPGHPGGWDPNRWNSARCDTAETNIFPVEGLLANMPGMVAGRYASMYHEEDPKYATLGVPKNRCFVINPAGPINSTNITCGAAPFPPAWAGAASGLSPSEGGLPAGVTREFSQIIPDGQLTPGSHVQYFLRLSDAATPTSPMAFNPDTQTVFPQVGCVLDGARWAQFGVLPDRWKEPAFAQGGNGMACVLVLDYDDGAGDEFAWVSLADSIGLTTGFKRGAHNGWGGAPPGASVNDPAYFVRRHTGQAGTLWDLYSVRGSRDAFNGNAGSLGSRLAPRCTGCPSSGRESRQGPTSTMLRNYRLIVLLSGKRETQILGPVADRGQNDVQLLQEFATLPGGSPQPRGMWFTGSGFGESEAAGHPAFLQNYLRAGVRSGDYIAFSGGNLNPSVVFTVPTLGFPSKDLGLRSNSHDVFSVITTTPAGQGFGFYENVGAQGPYVGSVYGPNSGGVRPIITLLDGFDLADLGSVGNMNTSGRQRYVADALNGIPFGSISCSPVCFCGAVEGGADDPSFLTLAGNPVRGGSASIRLAMPRAERAKVAIYDVSGRLLKSVTERAFEKGTQTVTWDGSDAGGTRVAPGIYWVHASTGSGIHAVKSVVVLR